MASVTEHTTSLTTGILPRVSAFLSATGTALFNLTSHGGRMREIDRLRALTDQDLAAQGLTRDQIVAHVYRDTYYL